MLSITALSIKYRTFTRPATADTMPSTDMLKGGEFCFDYLSDDDDHNSDLQPASLRCKSFCDGNKNFTIEKQIITIKWVIVEAW